MWCRLRSRSTAADGTVLATLEERFAIRGRTGAAELTDPVRAGGAVSDNATDTPRRRRRDVTITAPTDMRPFAVVSGDHNPIHTDRAAALLAGLKVADRARHVAVGGRAARRHRHRRPGQAAGAADRLDRAVPRHGRAGRRNRLPRRPRRNRPGRRGFGGRSSHRSRAGDVGDRAARRAEDRLRVPRSGHSAQGHGHGGPRPVEGRPQGVGLPQTSSPARRWASRCCTWCATTRPA